MTEVDALVNEFKAVYDENYLPQAMAYEILVLLDQLDKAKHDQSAGYVRRKPDWETRAPKPEPLDPIDDAWIKNSGADTPDAVVHSYMD